jgi:hypothetical protein
MKSTRKLALKKETLSDLSGQELRDVVGAAAELSGRTCPVRACLYSEYNCLLPTREGCTPATPA